MPKSEISVLTDKQIKQKLAGYKSNYTKKVKAAKTAKERKALENNRDAYIAERLHEILEQNRKQIQRRAGARSWESRRANSSKTTVKEAKSDARKENVKAVKSRGSRMGIRIVTR